MRRRQARARVRLLWTRRLAKSPDRPSYLYRSESRHRRTPNAPPRPPANRDDHLHRADLHPRYARYASDAGTNAEPTKVWGLIPFIIALLAQAKDTVLHFLGFQKPSALIVVQRASKAANDAVDIVEPASSRAFEQALNQKQVALVDFGATWCVPCQKIAPVFADEARLRGDAMTFIKVDVDKLEDVAEAHKVTSLPCFVLFSNGKEVARETRGSNEAALRSFIATHVKIEL